jgi:D-3-phosphoglycerate dehydrogenase
LKIAILDDYQNVVSQLKSFDLLKNFQVEVFTEKFLSAEQMIKALADFEALVLIRERSHLDAVVLSGLPKLKMISQTGRPGEHIDLEFCKEKGIEVLSGQGNPHAPAELTWALVMSAQRRLPHYVNSLHQGCWQSGEGLSGNPRMLGRSLKDKTLGIFGLGKIGTLVAEFGRVFRMNVLVYGRESSNQKATNFGYEVAKSKEEFFSRSDVLSLHLRSQSETKGIVTFNDLLLMKPDSIFVNTSRANLIETNAIEKCLKSGQGPHIFALDVFEQEPLTEPIQSERLLLTPHLGFVELETFETYFDQAFRNLVKFFEGMN